MIKKCPICEAEFEGTKIQKYCSPSCSTEAERRREEEKKTGRRKGKIELTCLWCHSKFETIYPKQMFCFSECRERYHRMKQRIFKLHPFEDTTELHKELAEKGKDFVLR